MRAAAAVAVAATAAGVAWHSLLAARGRDRAWPSRRAAVSLGGASVFILLSRRAIAVGAAAAVGVVGAVRCRANGGPGSAARLESGVAIFHLSVKTIGRAQGRSATAAAAYRAAARIEDQRTGLAHDYTRKGGVLHREIVSPEHAPAWVHDRASLWNAAELAEKRKNSTVAREVEVALPAELGRDDQRALACRLAREIVARHGCAVDVSFHAPSRQGDDRNHHAHLLLTTRRLTCDGFSTKTRELDDAKTGEVTRWRERWAYIVNERLEERGIDARVDHRSLAAQGIEREPTCHKGPAINAIERRAERSIVTEREREAMNERLAAAAELGRLARDVRFVGQAIVDTETRLQTALAARREAGRRTATAAATTSLEATRREARDAWAALRDSRLSSEPALTRREAAREAWLAQRNPSIATSVTASPDEQQTEKTPTATERSIILPDDDRAL